MQIRENVLACLLACNGVAEVGDEVTMDNCISASRMLCSIYAKVTSTKARQLTYKSVSCRSHRKQPAEVERSMVGPASMDDQQQRISKPSTVDGCVAVYVHLNTLLLMYIRISFLCTSTGNQVMSQSSSTISVKSEKGPVCRVAKSYCRSV